MWLAAAMPPAPGIFCGTTVGFPGMWRPRWRAIGASILIIAAANGGADDQTKVLAFVKVGNGVGAGSGRQAGEHAERDARANEWCKVSTHHAELLRQVNSISCLRLGRAE